MIKPTCDRCMKELEEPGAVVLSPPFRIDAPLDGPDVVQKFHICSACWISMRQWIMTARRFIGIQQREPCPESEFQGVDSADKA